MWPGFDSQTRRHMWVEFIVVSRPCSKGLSPSPPVFPPSSKSNFAKFQFDLESEGHRFISRRLSSVTLVKQSRFLNLFYSISHSYSDRKVAILESSCTSIAKVVMDLNTVDARVFPGMKLPNSQLKNSLIDIFTAMVIIISYFIRISFMIASYINIHSFTV